MSGNGAFSKANDILSVEEALVSAAHWLRGLEPKQLQGGNLDGTWHTPPRAEQAHFADVARAYCAYVDALVKVRGT
jgi:hypothetical protein